MTKSKTKPPKGLLVTQQLAAGEALHLPPLHFQVSGYKREWTQQLVLRGYQAYHIHHFIDAYRNALRISAPRTAALHREPWGQRYHGLFTKLAGGALNRFLNSNTIWSPTLGYGEVSPFRSLTQSPEELLKPALYYAQKIGVPFNLLYEPIGSSLTQPGRVNSYRVNIHSLRREGFIGSHYRGYRYFRFANVRSFSVEGTKALKVGAETLVTLKVEKGRFHKADFSLSCEPLL